MKSKRFVLTLTSVLALGLLSQGCASWSSEIPGKLQAQLDQLPQLITNELKESVNSIDSLPLPTQAGLKLSETQIGEVEKKILAQINQDRSQQGLKPVVWDETAAQAARAHVQEEADQGYISHWGMDGRKPQQRYTLGGGLDAVQENESVTLWTKGGFLGISQEELLKTVTEHEVSMVNEKPPDDGHRKNILEPHHTGVGIAIAVGKYGVAMAQEFTNHYLEMKPVPKTAAPGEKVTLSGRVLPGAAISGIYAIWEELPQPLGKDELMKTHSYSDPTFENLHFWARPKASGYYIPTKSGNIMATNLTVDKNGNFSIQVPLVMKHALDYISIEVTSPNNTKDRFYAAQFVIEH